MTEGIRVIETMELDGERIDFGHGVLICSRDQGLRDCSVILLDVSRLSLRLIKSECEALIVQKDGRRVRGTVESQPERRRLEYTKLVFSGEAVDQSPQEEGADSTAA